MTAGFDTDASVKTLTAAGMPEGQAEAVTELIKLSREPDLSLLATKADLAPLKADLGQLRVELQRDIAETKADILKWLVGMIAGAVVINVMAIIGAMLTLVRLLGG
jgi:hypothetical protein